MLIRYFQKDDAVQIANVFKRSVLELGPFFYSNEQVVAWAARGPTKDSILTRNAGGLTTVVSVNEAGDIEAYGELEQDGHIDQLYAVPEARGTNVIPHIYDRIELLARERNHDRLYTEASEGARRFFLKKGFIDRGRRDFEIEGITIHNYAMDKAL